MSIIEQVQILDFSKINLNSDFYHNIENLSNQKLIFAYFGKQEYNKMWKFQKKVHELVRKNKIPSIIMFLEHNNVYTFGKNSNKDFLLNSCPNEIDKIESDRGGQVTYHGPGQLIGYPIINLNQFKKSISWYMRSLENVIIKTLFEYNIDSIRKETMTGVWVADEKICAMGVRISRWVTMHGFALNIKPNMEYFDHMIPCGIFEYGVTSMYDLLNKNIPLENIIESIAFNFEKVFMENY